MGAIDYAECNYVTKKAIKKNNKNVLIAPKTHFVPIALERVYVTMFPQLFLICSL